MNLYMVLFFWGFILAVGLLAYASTQVAELSKKTEDFGNSLRERYSKPLRDAAEKNAVDKNVAEKDTPEKETTENKT